MPNAGPYSNFSLPKKSGQINDFWRSVLNDVDARSHWLEFLNFLEQNLDGSSANLVSATNIFDRVSLGPPINVSPEVLRIQGQICDQTWGLILRFAQDLNSDLQPLELNALLTALRSGKFGSRDTQKLTLAILSALPGFFKNSKLNYISKKDVLLILSNNQDCVIIMYDDLDHELSEKFYDYMKFIAL